MNKNLFKNLIYKNLLNSKNSSNATHKKFIHAIKTKILLKMQQNFKNDNTNINNFMLSFKIIRSIMIILPITIKTTKNSSSCHTNTKTHYKTDFYFRKT